MDTNLGRVVESICKELKEMQPVLKTVVRDYQEDALVEVFVNTPDEWFISQVVERLSNEHPEYLIGCASNRGNYLDIVQKDGTTKYVLMIIS